MRNIITLCFLPVMIAVVHLAPVNDNWKKIIIDEVNKTLHQSNWTGKVAQVWGEGPTTCVTEFFCLAEKALSEKHENETLTRTLNKYNKAMNHTDCTLKTDARCPIRKLLNKIKECAERLNLKKLR